MTLSYLEHIFANLCITLYFPGPKQHVPAMNRVKSIVANSQMTGKIFPLAQAYSGKPFFNIVVFSSTELFVLHHEI
jgi:hypothetical protein